MSTDFKVKKINRTAAVHNLGCKANAYESEAMISMLRDAGYEIVPFSQRADVYVINTCTVTNIADRKSRQMIHRARHLNPDAVVVAAGCYVQTHQEQIIQDQDVDIVIGTNEKSHLIELLESKLPRAFISDISKEAAYDELPAHMTQERCRAFLKIQDGCNQFCSYCAIPLARGRIRSRKPADVLAEARLLAQAGYKEIVLTGIHLCSYGIDFIDRHSQKKNNMDLLIQLIKEMASIDGLSRIRLGSLEPGSMSEKVISQLAMTPQVCPHFHLSLQSGCDATLKRMNRHYSTTDFERVCALLRSYYHEPTLTTDVIVGFPGETEAEFQETYRFLERIRFYHTHIFKYSRRDGTRAAAMTDQVPEKIKTERSHVLNSLDRSMNDFYRKKFAGNTVEVLLEERADNHSEMECWIGHTDGYLKVEVYGSGFRENELITGVIGKEIHMID